jgi:competence protein ComEC
MKKNGLWGWIKMRPLAVVIMILVVVDLLLFAVLARVERGELTVSFLDVGQGDAVFIESPSGNQMLYDAGLPTGALARELSRVMPFWDRSIDVAVLSHPDQDHIGGFPDAFARYEIDLAIVSGAVSNNGVYDMSERAIANEPAKKIVARRGMRIFLGKGAYADILYPDREMKNMETNSASIVMRVVYDDTAVLLSGDLPQAIENHIATLDGTKLRANILKAGHHGSRTSTSPYWLSAVSPDEVVISAGKDNRYGHPHKEVLDLLNERNIPFLGTFDEGTITFASDGTTFVRR